MTDLILVLNAGSSSLKFSLYDAGSMARAFYGDIDAIPTHPTLCIYGAEEEKLHEKSGFETGFKAALSQLLSWCDARGISGQIAAAGHRVVHGGTRYSAPILLDSDVVSDLKALIPLAPLHQPYNMEAIETFFALHPGIPQVACFDTAFHRTQDIRMQHYALPESYIKEGIVRYGFHGLSYQYIASVLPDYSSKAHGSVVVAHLGNGASMCAMRDLQSVGTTMGFSALDGLMMGTRCGAIDPGILLYLLQSKNMTHTQLETLLYKESGLKGVSGISHDVRDLLASSDKKAGEAIDLFCYNAARQLASLLPTIGGLDTLVFTAGIGAYAPAIRTKICAHLAWLGIELDEDANGRNSDCISRVGSVVEVLRIVTDEEVVIARATLGLVKK